MCVQNCNQCQFKGLPIRGSRVSGAKKDVEKWLNDLGLTK